MKKKYTTTIDEDILKKAKIKAIEENKNLNDIIEELLKSHLNEKMEWLNVRNNLKSFYKKYCYNWSINGNDIFLYVVRSIAYHVKIKKASKNYPTSLLLNQY